MRQQPRPLDKDAPQAVERMLEQCRDYLQIIANHELPCEIHPKCAPSDVVQQSIAEAWQSFGKFRGQNEAELRGWLRQILLHNIRDVTRKFRETTKRGIHREIAFSENDSQAGPVELLVARDASPSTCLSEREDLAKLKEAMSELPTHYLEVIRLRNLEELPFAEIGRRLSLSADSARKLWERAVRRLTKDLRRLHGPN